MDRDMDRILFRVNRKALFDAILDAVYIVDGNDNHKKAIVLLYGSNVNSSDDLRKWLIDFYMKLYGNVESEWIDSIFDKAKELRNITLLQLDGEL